MHPVRPSVFLEGSALTHPQQRLESDVSLCCKVLARGLTLLQDFIRHRITNVNDFDKELPETQMRRHHGIKDYWGLTTMMMMMMT